MHPAVSNGSYDVAKIRTDFPALSMQVYGKPLVYLDNAASALEDRSSFVRKAGDGFCRYRLPTSTSVLHKVAAPVW